MSGIWDQLVDCICRPPRDRYTPNDLIGQGHGLFQIGPYEGFREDIELINKRGLKLQCSHFIPTGVKGQDGRLPCVIYCHCNSGSRRDAEEALYLLIPLGVAVFTLDFAGSGLSGGSYVTLGALEADDLEVAVHYLRDKHACSTLGLWGRSMGAVTALLYSQRDPTIAGMVLDSPFSKLTELMMEIVEEQRLPIPKMLMKLVLSSMRKSVRKKAGFDIHDVAPLDHVGRSYIPALFGHATEDHFIKMHHSQRLSEAYAGEYKNLITFPGDHNSRRPEFFYTSVSIFFHNVLRLNEMLTSGKVDARGAAQRSKQAMMQHRLDSPRHANGTTAAPWDFTCLSPRGGSQQQQQQQQQQFASPREHDAKLQAYLDNYKSLFGESGGGVAAADEAGPSSSAQQQQQVYGALSNVEVEGLGPLAALDGTDRAIAAELAAQEQLMMAQLAEYGGADWLDDEGGEDDEALAQAIRASLLEASMTNPAAAAALHQQHRSDASSSAAAAGSRSHPGQAGWQQHIAGYGVPAAQQVYASVTAQQPSTTQMWRSGGAVSEAEAADMLSEAMRTSLAAGDGWGSHREVEGYEELGPLPRQQQQQQQVQQVQQAVDGVLPGRRSFQSDAVRRASSGEPPAAGGSSGQVYSRGSYTGMQQQQQEDVTPLQSRRQSGAAAPAAAAAAADNARRGAADASSSSPDAPQSRRHSSADQQQHAAAGGGASSDARPANLGRIRTQVSLPPVPQYYDDDPAVQYQQESSGPLPAAEQQQQQQYYQQQYDGDMHSYGPQYSQQQYEEYRQLQLEYEQYEQQYNQYQQQQEQAAAAGISLYGRHAAAAAADRAHPAAEQPAAARRQFHA